MPMPSIEPATIANPAMPPMTRTVPELLFELFVTGYFVGRTTLAVGERIRNVRFQSH